MAIAVVDEMLCMMGAVAVQDGKSITVDLGLGRMLWKWVTHLRATPSLE